ncbi:MAG: phosphatidylserine decarboxylase family protein [Chitinophagaceae bacterium]
MKIHYEGFVSILIAIVIVVVINILSFYFIRYKLISYTLLVLTLLVLTLVIFFFRVPNRIMTFNEHAIVAPADGKIVMIAEVIDQEYFNDKRLQISIFMSPLNVHVNRYGISGEVIYSTYHPGKYLVAWHPKSSILNEHHTTVIRNDKITILEKQIAGFLARRIVNYAKVGDSVRQNQEMGFIKFGSRVDILLPIATKHSVKIGDIVQGGTTILAIYK